MAHSSDYDPALVWSQGLARPTTPPRLPLGENLLGDPAVDVGQTVIAAAVAIGQFLVIEAEQVQHGGVQVVLVELVDGGPRAVVIGGAVAVLDGAKQAKP